MASLGSQVTLPEHVHCVDFNAYYAGVFCAATFKYDDWFHGGHLFVGKVHADRASAPRRAGGRDGDSGVGESAGDGGASSSGIELLGHVDNKIGIKQCQWSEHYHDMAVVANYDGTFSLYNLNLAVEDAATAASPGGGAPAAAPRGRLANVVVESGHAINCVNWNHLLPDFILAGGSSSRLHLFSLRSLDLIAASFSEHTKAVSDVKWNNNNPDEFASVGQDGLLKIWDRRRPASSVSTLLDKEATGTGEPSPLRCCDWHKQDDWLIVVGNADGQVLMWDIRNTLQPLRRRGAHRGAVACAKFDTTRTGRLATCGALDNTVRIWDTSTDGIYLTQEHRGHRQGVTSLDWDIHNGGMITSCGMDRLLISKPVASMTQVREYYREGRLVTDKSVPSLAAEPRSKL